MRGVVLALLAGPAFADAVAVPDFIDETASSGITSVYKGDWEFMTGGGVAAFDCSGDGKPELFMAGGAAIATLYRNDSTTGGPLEFTAIPSGAELDRVALHQDGANRDAIGGWIEVRSGEEVQRREITSGGGHAGGQLGWWHFGLGNATEAEVRVIWPDGSQGDWARVTADDFFDLVRGRSPKQR